MDNAYRISDYGGMIADRVRTDAYVRALRQAVTPGAVVVDIGTGAGLFALLACRFGARRVYAIEPNDVIQLARDLAAANGFADRIEFLQALSTQVTLPERADVIVSDLRGMLPLFEHHLTAIADARRRLLAAGGVMIPQRDTLVGAVVEAPDLYDRDVASWTRAGYGFNMQAAHDLVANHIHRARIKPDQLLSDARSCATLDYRIVESPDIRSEMTWTASRDGTGHGFAVWFDATLAEDVGYSNAPTAGELVYGIAFFPWPEPVPLAVGDTVSVVLQADLVGDDYTWRWDSCIQSQGQPTRLKGNFRQGTLYGTSLSVSNLRKRYSGHVPVLNDHGRSDCFMLDMMRGETRLDEIARRAFRQFPARFTSERAALARARELSETYSQ